MNPLNFEIMEVKVRIDDLRELLKTLERNEIYADCASFVVFSEKNGQIAWEQPSGYSECFGETGVLKTENHE